MKANIRRSYNSLPYKEQEKIKQVAYEIAKEQFAKDLQLIMDQLIKMSCQTLHTTFGFGERRMTYYLGSLRRTFSRNIKANRDGIMLQELDRQMQHIFRRDGYPDALFQQIFQDWNHNKGESQ